MSYFVLPGLFVCYLDVSFDRLITSVGEELVFLFFLFEGVPLPVGAWERLRYLSLVVSKPVFGVSDQV